MGYDYELGFRERPKDLEKVLLDRGFTLQRVIGPNEDFPFEMRTYGYFNTERSKRGVWITYHDGIYPDHDEIWGSIAPGEKLVATASITIPWWHNSNDIHIHTATAYQLKEYYNAVLYDPQEGEVL